MLGMIISCYFKDDPVWIQNLQYDLYWDIISLPFSMARETYLRAEKILGIATQLGKDCLQKDGIDHRVLQYYHDTIAAKFRYEYVEEFGIQVLSTLLSDDAFGEEIKQRWVHFFTNKIRFMLDDYPHLARQILIAVTYPNPDKRGKDAENIIYGICENMRP
jgi:hypothetical protein